jgi:phosphatidylglycerophosphatase A
VRPEPEVPRSLSDRIAMVLATGFGAGYGPIAPGTWGSLPALALAWALARTGTPWAVPCAGLVFAAAGFWAAGRAASILGATDPGQVVIDEIAGQLVTLSFLPATAAVLAAGFVLFRVLDVWKPWPARRLEDLPGGAGIMADDLAVGVYGNLILQAVVAWRPGLLGLA